MERSYFDFLEKNNAVMEAYNVASDVIDKEAGPIEKTEINFEDPVL